MSEESISYIWGQQVTGDKPIVIKPSELPAFLIINRAVLVEGVEATVSIDVSGSKFAIAKLRKDTKDQTTLDLKFWELPEDEEETFTLSVNPKAAKVDLTGFYQQEEEGYGSYDEDDDESAEGPYGPMTVEDVTDAEAEKAIKAEEKKAKAKEQQKQPKQQSQPPKGESPKQQGKKEKKGKQAEKKQATTPKQTTPTPAPTHSETTATAETSTPAASATETKTEASTTDASTAPTTPTAATELGAKKRKADTPNKGQNKKQKATTPATSGASTPTNAVKCPDCGKDFKGDKALEAHSKAKHKK
eukprot:TRINITY_DN63_c1_g1_i3.p1 TRINITY_DN63_c1_g1~~TRINITY_DN63_c1_g1_i3.p1  ORF type:complete len:303 (+),score=117.53 TRINITY_DN63_c1_g1_i3:1104-2012(+)